MIVKLSAIGDVVHSLPLLEVLRHNYPDATIDWLVEEEAGQVIEGHEALDHIIVSRRKIWQKEVFKPGKQWAISREIVRLIRELRSKEYDLVIDLQGLLKSGILTGLCRGKRKIGFTGGREGSSFFLTEKPYEVDYDKHALDRYLMTADFLGCEVNSWKSHIPLGPEDKKPIDDLIHERDLHQERLVAINPMARWKTKLWGTKRFSELAERIHKSLSCDIIFTGGGADRSVVNEIIHGMAYKPINLAGETSLKGLAYLYSRCRLLVTTDTGPMHIAAAMGCPVVALFGPTAPWRTGPYGEGHVVIREDMECSPCFKKSCEHLTCMKEITVDKVFDAVRGIYGHRPA